MSNESNGLQFFPKTNSIGRSFLWISSIAILYFIAARLSLTYIFLPEGIAAIWPSAGLFLSALLLSKPNLRLWLTITLFITDLIAQVLAGTPPLISLMYAAIVTGNAILSFWLLQRFVGLPITFNRLRELTGWLILTVIISNSLASLAAAASAALFFPEVSFWTDWMRWFASDAIGNLIITPLVISWAAWYNTHKKPPTIRRVLEGGLMMILLSSLSIVSFHPGVQGSIIPLLNTYLIFPFLLWAAIRFRVRGVASASAALTAISIYFASAGNNSIFLGQNPSLDSMLVLQVFLTIMTIPALFLAAVMSERRQVESALLSSKKLIQDFTDNSASLIYSLDLEGHFFLINRQLEAILGIPRETMIGKNRTEFLPPEIAKAHYENDLKVIAQGVAITFEEENIERDGKHTYLSHKFPLYDAHGKIYGITGISTDITDRKRTESELKQRVDEMTALHQIMLDLSSQINLTDLLKMIVEKAADLIHVSSGGLYTCDPDCGEVTCMVSYNTRRDYTGTKIKYGEGAAGIVAQTGKALIINDYRNWSHRASVFEVDKPFYAVLAVPMTWQGQTLGIIDMLQTQENTGFKEHDLGLLTLFAQQAALAIQNARLLGEKQAEINERLQTEQALHDLAERQVTILSAIPDILMEVDNNKVYTWANQNGLEFFGNDVLGTDASSYFLGEQDTYSRVTPLFQGDENVIYVESWQRRQDGESRLLAWWCRVLKDGQGNVTGAISSAHDITEHKQAELLQDAIYRIAQAADQVQDVESLYPSIHKIIHEVMPADNFYIALYDPVADMLSFPYAVDDEDPQTAPQKPGRGLTEYVLRTAMSLLCDEEKFEQLIQKDEVELIGAHSPIWLGVPLIIAGNVIGMMAVQDYNNPYAYTIREQRILEFVSSQVAMVIRRKQAEIELRASKSSLEAILRSTADGILAVGNDNKVLFANQRFAELWQIPPAILASNDDNTLLAHVIEQLSDPQLFINKVQELYLSHAESFDTLDFKDGRVFERLSFPLLQDNEMRGRVWSFRDITQRKQAEKDLRDSEERYRRLVETLPDGVIVHSQGRILFANPASASMSGTSNPQELIGKPVIEFVHPDYRTIALKRIQQSFETGVPAPSREEVFVRIDGSTFEVEVSAIPFIYDGKPAMLTVFTDISKRKAAEEKIYQLNSELEQRVEDRTRELVSAQEKLVQQEKLAVLGQIAGAMGHELRNPLGVIQNAIYYLKLVQPDVDEKIRQYHDMIGQEAQAAVKIIADLLDYAQVRIADRELFSLTEIITKAITRNPHPSQVRIHTDIPADIPLVYADPRQIQQVLGNLLINAYQAMPDGGEIHIAASTRQNEIAIMISDNGPGIPPQNMSKLFEPLFSTKVKGIGLGLSICKKLVEANQGHIEAHSESGKGCTIRFFLPTHDLQL